MNRIMLTALVAAGLGIAGVAHAAGNAEAGKAKATSCAMCHGPNGQGTKMGPKLAGMAPAAFIKAMDAFKAGQGNNPMMKAAAQQLSEQQIENLAAYYASLK